MTSRSKPALHAFTPATFRSLQKKAEGGDADAQVRLGLAYRSGNGIAQDPEQALVWLRRAAEQGDPRYIALLGVWSLAGDGIPQDFEEAEFWLFHAARQHNPLAWCFIEELSPERLNQGSDPIFNLFGLMHKASGFPENMGIIADWLGLVALGAPDPAFRAWAQFNLGLAFETGTLWKENLVEACAWKSLGAVGIKAEFDISLSIDSAELSPEQKTAGEQRQRELAERIAQIQADLAVVSGKPVTVVEIMIARDMVQKQPNLTVPQAIEKLRAGADKGNVGSELFPTGKMHYAPRIISFEPKERWRMGTCDVLLMGDIQADSPIQYRHLMVVLDEDFQPCFFVGAEIDTMFGSTEEGTCVLGIFDGEGHINCGSSPDWFDVEKFTAKALEIVGKYYPQSGH
jgi:TPR repeat protein